MRPKSIQKFSSHRMSLAGLDFRTKYERIFPFARRIYEKYICILKYDVFMENVFEKSC